MSIERHLNSTISKYGVAVMSVHGDESQPQFTYTIGLTETYSVPELIVFGLPPKHAPHFLMQLAEQIRDGKRFHDGQILEKVANMPLAIKDISNAKASEYAFLTFGRYADCVDRVKFQQLVWPDGAGRMPWDMAFDQRFSMSQPKLWTNQSTILQ